MISIGVDIGSTYTKYCVLDSSGGIIDMFSEKTPIRQEEYFREKVEELRVKYGDAKITSCGYGKKNIEAVNNISELVALAKGVGYVSPKSNIILDIGGQDTKVIQQDCGLLKKFFINDKCAAGSGMFLTNTLNLLQIDFNDLDMTKYAVIETGISIASSCAVFAQTEIVKLIATNHSEQEIIHAVIKHILTQAKPLLNKVSKDEILLTGGLSQITGIIDVASNMFDQPVNVVSNGTFLSAIGCAIIGYF